MKKNSLNTLLAAVVFLAVLVCVLVRAFAPNIILPALNIPNMVLLSLAALVAERYLVRDARRCWVCTAVLSGVTFGLLPWAAGFLTGTDALLTGLIGGITFCVTAWLYGAMTDRISSGPAKPLAPWVSALCLWLAAQVLTGMLL